MKYQELHIHLVLLLLLASLLQINGMSEGLSTTRVLVLDGDDETASALLQLVCVGAPRGNPQAASPLRPPKLLRTSHPPLYLSSSEHSDRLQRRRAPPLPQSPSPHANDPHQSESPPHLTGLRQQYASPLQQPSPPHPGEIEQRRSLARAGEAKMDEKDEKRQASMNTPGIQQGQDAPQATNDGGEGRGRKRRRRRLSYEGSEDEGEEEKEEVEEERREAGVRDYYDEQHFVLGQSLPEYPRQIKVKDTTSGASDGGEDVAGDEGGEKRPQNVESRRIMGPLRYSTERKNLEDINWLWSPSPARRGDNLVLAPAAGDHVTSEATWHLDYLDPRLSHSVSGSKLLVRVRPSQHLSSAPSSIISSPSPLPTLFSSRTSVSSDTQNQIPSLLPHENVSGLSFTPAASLPSPASGQLHLPPLPFALETPLSLTSPANPLHTRPIPRPSSHSTLNLPTPTHTTTATTSAVPSTRQTTPSTPLPLSSPLSKPDTPSRPSSPTPAPRQNPPARASALAVLRCSSGRARTTVVYVMQDCADEVGGSMPWDVMLLCPEHSLSLQQQPQTEFLSQLQLAFKQQPLPSTRTQSRHNLLNQLQPLTSPKTTPQPQQSQYQQYLPHNTVKPTTPPQPPPQQANPHQEQQQPWPQPSIIRWYLYERKNIAEEVLGEGSSISDVSSYSANAEDDTTPEDEELAQHDAVEGVTGITEVTSSDGHGTNARPTTGETVTPGAVDDGGSHPTGPVVDADDGAVAEVRSEGSPAFLNSTDSSPRLGESDGAHGNGSRCNGSESAPASQGEGGGQQDMGGPANKSVGGGRQDEGGHGLLQETHHEAHKKETWTVGVEDVGGQLRRASRDLSLNHYSRPDSAPQLRYTPIDQTVSPSSPVSLKCSALGSPTPVITWTRDHRPLLHSLRTRVGSFRTALGEVVSHVNLSQVTVRDGGTYTCTAHNTHGSQAHSARLNVYGPPFVRAMDNVTTVAGEDVKLWCPAGGFPTPSVTWRRDGHALPTSLRQELLSNGTLVVRGASHEDAGRYSCVVSGRQGQTAASHTFLHVLKPPAIEPLSFRRNLQEAERTLLTCMVNSGDLPITVNWLKDGRHLQHDPDIDIKQISEYSTVLLFKRLREHHSGSYTCEAANAAATVNQTATVRVKVAPRWVTEPASGSVLVGSTVVLDCSARGYPQPTLTWLKATGEAAQDFQSVVLDGVRASQAPNGSLVLPDVTTSHAGWYLCRAANSVGKPISKVVQLTVRAPARVLTEGRRVTGHAGQTVTVPCEATGDDPLTLTWQRHHNPILPGHRTSVRENSAGGTLRAVLEIRAVTAADAGPYTCRATNPHGDHSQVFKIAVIEPPTAPSGVVVSEVTSRSARISWSLPQPAAVTIQYRASEEESWASHGRNVSVGQWASWHMLTGLTPYHTYAVRLMAHNDLGVSQPSTVHVFITLEEAPSGAPRDVRVAAGGPRSLLVTWRAPPHHLTHGPLRGYTIALRRQKLQGHPTYITRPISLTVGEAEEVEQYEVRGLTPASLYEVAVRAFNKAGPGPLSSPRIVDSTSHDAPSCPPAGVTCRGLGRGSVRVWWSPPPSHCTHAPVSGYTIVASPTKHVHHHSSSSSTWEVNTTNLEKNLDALPPATNISVRVKAFNEVGYSPSNDPVFCITEDDVPGPPRRVRVIVTGATTLLVTWSPPHPHAGNILHYTLYSARDDQVAVRDVVGAGGSEATWRELSGLTPGSRIQVWVTATTVAGEGSQSPRLTALPTPTPTHAPIAVGGGRSWRVGVGSGVTLGCRGLGSPPPTISWKKASATISSSQLTQLLPGGDLHLVAVRETTNYTCWVRNNVGADSLTHQVVAVTTPPSPTLTLAHATHDALNLTITPAGDGGAPILGYTVHHRGRAGEWMETTADPGVRSVVVRDLPCGAPYHLYLTAWNSFGTSSPSPVLLTNTLGSPPGRPDPARLVEVNATCVTLCLYVWPELGCPVTHWKVELGSGEAEVSWSPLHPHVTRDTADLGLCDLTSASWHLLRITASSTAGDTSVVYRVATRDQSGGPMAAEPVQEVLVGGPVGETGWLDAHVVAGVVSAVLLAAALIICVCVAVRRRRYGGYRQGDNVDSKGGGEEDNARNSEITRAHLYSPTPTKKPHGSLTSLKTQDDPSDPYEICPYATFSVGSSEGTLEYGLSFHALTPRDCLDHPLHSDRHTQQSPAYGQTGRQRAQSHYKETGIAYISNRNRGDYASRPKSISGAHPSAAPTPAPAGETSEQRAWSEDSRKDTRSRPHRSRSRTRAEVARRDSSTESNDASSPVQQRQRYQHPQIPPQQQQQQQQQLPPQQQGGGAVAAAVGRAGPHPLPPVRHARVRSESSSSETSPLTPPRPLHPPSAFSDSRELSEAECDREMRQSQTSTSGDAPQPRGRRGQSQGGSDGMTAELTVLLQRYEQRQQKDKTAQQKHQQNLYRGPQKNPYSINV